MTAFFVALISFFKFFDECYALTQQLKITPAEKHAEVMTKITGVFDETNAAHINRPGWDIK
jgi:hypothetical protein